LLTKHNFNICFKTDNNLCKFIKNNKSGVYKLSCGSCHKKYVGQTGRSFKKRISEHKRSFLNQKTDSTYSNHIIEENHDFDENFEILHINSKGTKLNFLEALEINRLKNSENLLNDQTDINNSPLLNLFTVNVI
jgi:GIY-YIG catalytic domain